MKKLLFLLLAVMIHVNITAQVPYYSGTQGKGNTYTYLSTKFHPGENNQQMYITASHGILDKLDIVTDATVGTGYLYQGFGLRANAVSTKYFGLGFQDMLSFDLNDSYKVGYNCASAYMNGAIVDGLHWVTNTWWTWYRGGEQVVEQWWYLGWTVKKFTPMVGLDHYWTDLDRGTDLMVGCYFTHKNMNYYLWGSNLTKNLGDCRIVIGFDYKF